jgi:hypothetical protein
VETPEPEAERASPGRRAVLIIFGGVVFVLVVAGYLATQFRAGTRERLVPPHPTTTAPAAP